MSLRQIVQALIDEDLIILQRFVQLYFNKGVICNE